MGRISSYSEEIATTICEMLAEGESLRTICRLEGMPNRVTVWRWQEENEAFRNQYARAREQQAETFADEIVTIADEATDAQLARLQVDARKWAASKLAPKKYGDKVTNEHQGPDGGPIKTENVSARDVLFSRIAGLAARSGTSEGESGDD